MANNHYACYVFPRRVYDRYQAAIDAIFEEHGGPDQDVFNEVGAVRFSCPVCSSSSKIDEVFADKAAPWSDDPFFAMYSSFSDGIDFDDHQSFVIGRKGIQIGGDDPEHPLVSFTLDADRRLLIEDKARNWMRAFAAFWYYCGRGRIFDAAQRHTVGGRSDHCPRCNSIDVDAEGVDVRGDHAVQECSCCNCGCSWRGVYMLIGADVDPKEDDDE